MREFFNSLDVVEDELEEGAVAMKAEELEKCQARGDIGSRPLLSLK